MIKCTSCKAEIDPKWKHAIDVNLCPFCGKLIMLEEVKTLLASLNSCVEGLLSYPEYLEDWLSARFNFVKAEKVKELEDKLLFLNKKMSTDLIVKNDKVESVELPPTENVESSITSVQDQAITNQFFRKAEVDKVVSKNKHLKDLVSQIKKNGSEMLIANEDSDDEFSVQQGPSPDSWENTEVSSALSAQDDDEIHPSALALAAAVKSKGNGSNYNPNDIAKLQELQGKTSSSRNRMLQGGGKGSFSR